MTKSQLNIKISKDLLTQFKRQAIKSGKSLTEHLTDLVTKSLSENDIENKDFHSLNATKHLEERLLNIESIVSNLEYLSLKLKPFTDSEAINCTKFMRGLFEQKIKKSKFENLNEAFDDLYKHINYNDNLSQYFTDRLKQILLENNPKPWTGNELNELTNYKKCNCIIRKGLINWTGKIDCPSQQEICDKGEELLPLC